MLSHKIYQIYIQYPNSIFSLFIVYIKPDFIRIIISGIITDLPLQTHPLLQQNLDHFIDIFIKSAAFILETDIDTHENLNMLHIVDNIYLNLELIDNLLVSCNSIFILHILHYICST